MRRHRRRVRKPAELLLVPMIDIFTVLVTFLLMTAVFSRIAVIELDLPSAAGPQVTEPSFRLEVIVRKDGLELTNGNSLIAALPKANGEYDLAKLSELALSLKRDHPEVDDASVLLEPDIEYDDLIQVMDAIRSVQVPATAAPNAAVQGSPGVQDVVAAAGDTARPRMDLFTDIAVGDAP